MLKQFLCPIRSAPAAVATALLALVLVAAPAGAVPPRVTAILPDPGSCVSRDLDPNFGGWPFSQVRLTFDQPVTVPLGAIFAHTAMASDIPLIVSPLNTPTTTATVTFAPINAERLILVVDHAVTNAAGEPLDGEILDPRDPDLTTAPSGDGWAGGQAVFDIRVLQGDVNCNGVISASDTVALLNALPAGCDAGHPAYNPGADLDTNGCIELADLFILNRSAGNIPAGDAAAPQVVSITPARLPLPNPVVSVQFTEPINPARIARTSLLAVGDDGTLVEATADPTTVDTITFEFTMESLPALQDYDFTVCNSVFDVSGEMLALTMLTLAGTDTDGDGIDDDGDGDGTTDNAPCTGGAVVGCDDNCPQDVNFGQEDADVDGVGDVCDVCPGADDSADSDGDARADGCDNCPETANADQADADGDDVGDACDNCPNVPNPGQEVSPTNPTVGLACAPPLFVEGGGGSHDADRDGIPDMFDRCPDTPAREAVDRHGCSDGQRDTDADGVVDRDDLCPATPVDETADEVGCSESQRDDDEGPQPTSPPAESPSPLADTDGDNVVDAADLCPDTPLGTAVDKAGCPYEPVPHPTPPPQQKADCGEGAPCGALGLVNAYLMLMGLDWIRRRRKH